MSTSMRETNSGRAYTRSVRKTMSKPLKKLPKPKTVRENTTARFLLFPTFTILVNFCIAAILSNVYFIEDSQESRDWRAVGQSMSSFLASTSIGIVTLTFSLTVLSIQMAAQTYSPRLLDDFLQDPISHASISINLGAYAYSYWLQLYLYHDPEEHGTPILAIHFLSVHTILVLIMFVIFVHHFINGFRLESILHKATEASWDAARKLEERREKMGAFKDELPNVPPTAYKVLSDYSGYLSKYRLHAVVDKAKKMNIVIRYHPNIGEFVAEGSLLAWVWDATPADDNKNGDSDESEAPTSLRSRVLKKNSKNNDFAVSMMDILQVDSERRVEEKLGEIIHSGIVIATCRSGELDVLLGVQQLTDVAVRALSAAVNDPMTAVQALDYLSSLFGRLAHAHFPIGCHRDQDGVVRATAPRRSFVYLLSILDAIRVYGAADLTVHYRMIRFYGDLGATLKRAGRVKRIEAVLAQMEQQMASCRKNFDANSTEMVRVEELYEHTMKMMISSNRPVMADGEVTEKDVTHLETTFVKPTPDFIKNLPWKSEHRVALTDSFTRSFDDFSEDSAVGATVEPEKKPENKECEKTEQPKETEQTA